MIEKDIDRYGRVVAEIILPGGKSLNRTLVGEGWAWHYAAYSKDRSLAVLEQKARVKKLGLWADPSPVEPWRYRRLKRLRSAEGTGV